MLHKAIFYSQKKKSTYIKRTFSVLPLKVHRQTFIPYKRYVKYGTTRKPDTFHKNRYIDRKRGQVTDNGEAGGASRNTVIWRYRIDTFHSSVIITYTTRFKIHKLQFFNKACLRVP
jgi:hypothetical protein